MANKVSIMFCGGCNPHIDRSKIARQIYQQLICLGYQVRHNCPDGDYLIYLSGCSVSCAYKDNGSKKPYTIIAGQTLNFLPANESALVSHTVQQVEKHFLSAGGNNRHLG